MNDKYIITVSITTALLFLSHPIYNTPLAYLLEISWYKSLTLTCKNI